MPLVKSPPVSRRINPRLAIFAPQQAIGGLVAEEAFLFRIPRYRAPELLRDVAEQAQRGGDVAFLNVGNRTLTSADAFEEIAPVRPTRRRDDGALVQGIVHLVALGIL